MDEAVFTIKVLDENKNLSPIKVYFASEEEILTTLLLVT